MRLVIDGKHVLDGTAEEIYAYLSFVEGKKAVTAAGMVSKRGRPRKNFTDEEKEKIKNMYLEGMEIKKIAFMMNRNVTSIRGFLENSGILKGKNDKM